MICYLVMKVDMSDKKTVGVVSVHLRAKRARSKCNFLIEGDPANKYTVVGRFVEDSMTSGKHALPWSASPMVS